MAARRKRARKHAQRLVLDRWLDRRVARAELDGEMVEIPRALLPENVSADTVLRVERTGDRVIITLDANATSDARREGERLVSKLRKRDPGGGVTL